MPGNDCEALGGIGKGREFDDKGCEAGGSAGKGREIGALSGGCTVCGENGCGTPKILIVGPLCAAEWPGSGSAWMARNFRLGRMEQASAMAVARSEALAKRAIGSFASARRITSERAVGIFGLIKLGGVGSAFTCCIIIEMGLSPRKGGTPVQIS